MERKLKVQKQKQQQPKNTQLLSVQTKTLGNIGV